MGPPWGSQVGQSLWGRGVAGHGRLGVKGLTKNRFFIGFVEVGVTSDRHPFRGGKAVPGSHQSQQHQIKLCIVSAYSITESAGCT